MSAVITIAGAAAYITGLLVCAYRSSNKALNAGLWLMLFGLFTLGLIQVASHVVR